MSAQDLSTASLESAPFSDFPAIRNEQEKSAQTRSVDGKFVTGVSGNPLGRPKSRHITEAYKAILETEGADKFARVVAEIATGQASKASDKLAAIQEITDRVEGKATQNIRHAGVFLVAAPGADTMAALDDWAGDE